jgi:hypothetical protein
MTNAPNAPISTALIFSTYQRLVLISPEARLNPTARIKTNRMALTPCIRLPRKGTTRAASSLSLLVVR